MPVYKELYFRLHTPCSSDKCKEIVCNSRELCLLRFPFNLQLLQLIKNNIFLKYTILNRNELVSLTGDIKTKFDMYGVEGKDAVAAAVEHVGAEMELLKARSSTLTSSVTSSQSLDERI